MSPHRTALKYIRRDIPTQDYYIILRGIRSRQNIWSGVIFIPKFKEDDIMRIEKLPSGSYRMRKMYKGKMYTVVTDYKPTRKEAIQLMADQLNQVQEIGRASCRERV